MKEYDLLKWKEFGSEDAPSIEVLFSAKPYPEQDRIADYLDRGEISLVSTSYDKDAITGELIYPLHSMCIRTNGLFSWASSLPYYVRKYNLRLPIAFEESILCQLNDDNGAKNTAIS